MKKLYVLSAICATAVTFYACHKSKDNSSNTTGSNVKLVLPDTTTKYFEGFVDDVNKKAEIGRVLFYDTHLSINNAVACASCHKQQEAFADNVAFSAGYEHKLTGRNSQPIQNLNGGTKFFNSNIINFHPLFWDGRATDIKSFMQRPITNHVEMGIVDQNALVEKLANLSYYKPLFQKAYGTDDIDMDKVSECLSYFVSSINCVNTRYDQYVAGTVQLTAQEMQGLNLFNEKYNCASCHRVEPTGYQNKVDFKDIGLDMNPTDKGRGTITGDPADNGTFRLPNLRNVALTAPYMHDGRFKTLDEVLEHYSKNIQNTRNLAFELKDAKGDPIHMNISAQEKAALIAFLNTLTDYQMITDPKFSSPFVVSQ